MNYIRNIQNYTILEKNKEKNNLLIKPLQKFKIRQKKSKKVLNHASSGVVKKVNKTSKNYAKTP